MVRQGRLSGSPRAAIPEDETMHGNPMPPKSSNSSDGILPSGRLFQRSPKLQNVLSRMRERKEEKNVSPSVGSQFNFDEPTATVDQDSREDHREEEHNERYNGRDPARESATLQLSKPPPSPQKTMQESSDHHVLSPTPNAARKLSVKTSDPGRESRPSLSDRRERTSSESPRRRSSTVKSPRNRGRSAGEATRAKGRARSLSLNRPHSKSSPGSRTEKDKSRSSWFGVLSSSEEDGDSFDSSPYDTKNGRRQRNNKQSRNSLNTNRKKGRHDDDTIDDTCSDSNSSNASSYSSYTSTSSAREDANDTAEAAEPATSPIASYVSKIVEQLRMQTSSEKSQIPVKDATKENDEVKKVVKDETVKASEVIEGQELLETQTADEAIDDSSETKAVQESIAKAVQATIESASAHMDEIKREKSNDCLKDLKTAGVSAGLVEEENQSLLQQQKKKRKQISSRVLETKDDTADDIEVVRRSLSTDTDSTGAKDRKEAGTQELQLREGNSRFGQGKPGCGISNILFCGKDDQSERHEKLSGDTNENDGDLESLETTGMTCGILSFLTSDKPTKSKNTRASKEKLGKGNALEFFSGILAVESDDDHWDEVSTLYSTRSHSHKEESYNMRSSQLRSIPAEITTAETPREEDVTGTAEPRQRGLVSEAIQEREATDLPLKLDSKPSKESAQTKERLERAVLGDGNCLQKKQPAGDDQSTTSLAYSLATVEETSSLLRNPQAQAGHEASMADATKLVENRPKASRSNMSALVARFEKKLAHNYRNSTLNKSGPFTPKSIPKSEANTGDIRPKVSKSASLGTKTAKQSLDQDDPSARLLAITRSDPDELAEALSLGSNSIKFVPSPKARVKNQTAPPKEIQRDTKISEYDSHKDELLGAMKAFQARKPLKISTPNEDNIMGNTPNRAASILTSPSASLTSINNVRSGRFSPSPSKGKVATPQSGGGSLALTARSPILGKKIAQSYIQAISKNKGQSDFAHSYIETIAKKQSQAVRKRSFSFRSDDSSSAQSSGPSRYSISRTRSAPQNKLHTALFDDTITAVSLESATSLPQRQGCRRSQSLERAIDRNRNRKQRDSSHSKVIDRGLETSSVQSWHLLPSANATSSDSSVDVDNLVSRIDNVVHRLIQSGKLDLNNDRDKQSNLHQRTLRNNTAELLENLAILRARPVPGRQSPSESTRTPSPSPSPRTEEQQKRGPQQQRQQQQARQPQDRLPQKHVRHQPRSPRQGVPQKPNLQVRSPAASAEPSAFNCAVPERGPVVPPQRKPSFSARVKGPPKPEDFRPPSRNKNNKEQAGVDKLPIILNSTTSTSQHLDISDNSYADTTASSDESDMGSHAESQRLERIESMIKELKARRGTAAE